MEAVPARLRPVSSLTRSESLRPVLRYAAAALLAGAATVLTLVAHPLLQHTVLALFLAAIIVSAWFYGFGPGVATLALSMLATEIWILEPRGSLVPERIEAVVPLLVLTGLGLLIVAVSNRARRSTWMLRYQAAELQEQAMELEQQMESTQSLQLELEFANEQLERSNRELERNRDFLEQAQRSAQLGSWEWNVATDEVTWSDELFRIFGLEPGSVAMSFDSYLDRVHPDDRRMVAEIVRAAAETRQPFAFDHRVVHPDGAVRWIEGRGRVVLDEREAPVRMIGSGQDVTDRRRAAESQRFLAEVGHLLSTSLDYRVTLRNVADLAVRHVADWCTIAIGDSSGRYENLAVSHRDPERRKWAEEWARLHPPRFDTPTGVPQVLRTGKAELYPEITPELLERSGAAEDELRVIRELGLHSAMIVPMMVRNRVLGAITFISAESRHRFDRDDLWLAERLAGRSALAIDNARLYEEAQDARVVAEQANRAKMDFLAAMSHEFRTPLNAIAGYAQLLEIGLYGELSGEQREVLNRLQRSQHHLLGLVEQVLGFARVEAGKVEMHMKPVPVTTVISQASEMTAPQLQAKKLSFRCDFHDDDVSVQADEERLQQILVNLLTNAVKFTEPGGAITIDCHTADDTVVITVADTGVGIPPDKLEAVFEPFAQLPQATEKRSSGVGLGLAISRDLARAMGGDLTVESEVGRGSVFALSLPRA